VAATTALLALWMSRDWSYPAVPVGLFGAACMALGRHIEEWSRINRKLRAAIRPRPIVAARAATELNLRRIPDAHLPTVPPPVPR
jgi:hypothetical protein